MNVVKNLIPIGKARPGLSLDTIMAVVLHWPASPGADALAIRDFWAGAGNRDGTSAHCAIGFDGTIIQTVPWDEKAYHVGSSLLDPASKLVYTDLARSLFGSYAIDYKFSSPNRVTIGIEMCHLDDAGHYTNETIQAAAELCAFLLKPAGLDPLTKIVTHHLVVGYKLCPKFYCDHPDELDTFRKKVYDIMKG